MITQTQKKKQAPVYTNDNIVETIRGVGSSVTKTVVHDVINPIASDTLTTLFGAIPRSGEITPDKPVVFSREQEHVAVQEKRDWTQTPEYQEEQMKVQQQLQAVRLELSALAKSLKSLHQEVQKAATEEPVAPGIYHVNFFERLLTLVRVLRQQVDESRTWLALWNTKKKKMGYWGMFKKHGTQFGLSSERAIATAAG